MRASTIVSVSLLVFAVSCGGASVDSGTGTATSSYQESVQTPDDQEIARLIYDPDYSVPDGFFIDARATTPGSYTIHHVLDHSGSYEVCSNDYQSALNMEAADNASRAVRGTFVSSTESARYFEITRELAYNDGVGSITEPTSPGYARIFKCSNTERDGVDRNLLHGYAGTINARPIDAETIREFTEYLWQFRFFATGHRIVLSSVGDAREAVLGHTLQLAFRRSQGPDLCDLIEVAEWRFSVDTASGEVAKQFSMLRSFEARLSGGVPSLCD